MVKQALRVALLVVACPCAVAQPARLVDVYAPSAYTAEDGLRSLAFGGILRDASGVPQQGEYSGTFMVYDNLTAGTPLYSWSGSISTGADGRVGVTFGSSAGSTAVLGNGTGRYLSVEINGAAGSTRVPLNVPGQQLTTGSLTLTSILAPSAYTAEVGTRSLGFGGVLTDAAGTPVGGTHTATVKIYASQTGMGFPLYQWTESVTTTNGRFNVPLTGAGSGLADGTGRYVSVQIDGGDESARVTLNSLAQMSSGSLTVAAAFAPSEYTAELGKRSLAFGGTLLDQNGAATPGTYTAALRVYDSLTSSTPIFYDTRSITTASDGSFGLSLEDGTSSFFSGTDADNLFVSFELLGGYDETRRFQVNRPYQSVTLSPVPEPASIGLFATVVLAGCVAWRRFRNVSRMTRGT